MKRLGIIGTGHLASFLCSGLRKADWKGEIVVSPHNRRQADDFVDRFGATIADSGQHLVDDCELVMVAVRPDQADSALSDFDWGGGSLLLSVMAGVSIASLRAVAPGAEIVRAMPVSAAALNCSPTTLYPDNDIASALLQLLGSVIPLPSETAFEMATVNAAAYGWLFAQIDQLVSANVDAGVPQREAIRIVTETFTAAASVAMQSGVDHVELLSSLATPGGITEYGLQSLEQTDAIAAWKTAFDRVSARLKSSNR